MLNFSCLEGFSLSCRIRLRSSAEVNKVGLVKRRSEQSNAALLENFRMTQLRITVGFNTENTSKGYPQISHFHGIFHEINNPFGGTPMTMETYI